MLLFFFIHVVVHISNAIQKPYAYFAMDPHMHSVNIEENVHACYATPKIHLSP